MEAAQRYDGEFFRASAEALHRMRDRGQHVLILSGGYGVVRATEPISWYERRFRLSDWPRGLLEGVLCEYVRRHKLRYVVGFLSRTSDYSKLTERVQWATVGIDLALLVRPITEGRGGALRLVPSALGQAFAKYAVGALGPGFLSSEGLRLDARVLHQGDTR